MSKKILFLSSANLTVNPRLLKELKFAVEQKYDVHFVGFNLSSWSDVLDKEIVKNIDAQFNYIDVSRNNFKSWLISSVVEKVSGYLYVFFKKNLKINSYANSKRSFLLNGFLKKNKQKFDLIVAHTLPTLYPAYKLAKKTNTKFTFDIEDFHPGELVQDKTGNEVKRKQFLMKSLLPKADYVTYASPLIGKHSLDLAGNIIENHTLVNNCFSKSEFQFNESKAEKIKFVWFSQNIAYGRGLEFVVPALYNFKEKIELHLIGNLYQSYYDEYLSKYKEIIKIHKPLTQVDLNLKLSEFDIGLAIELNSADFNRQICLTNKIWSYLQAGLYILATDTPAQKQFMTENVNSGLITGQTEQDFEKSIADIITRIEEIKNRKKYRFESAKAYSWEEEKKKFNKIWI